MKELFHPTKTDKEGKDKDAFTYLKNVKVVDTFDKDRRKIRTMTLWFYENPYFTNESIEMTILYMNSDPDDPDVIRCTFIDWKEGKDLTVKRIKKKQKNKKSGRT
jgi:nucleosome assembly protein 1-like 1